jgi:hypothetical protein
LFFDHAVSAANIYSRRGDETGDACVFQRLLLRCLQKTKGISPRNINLLLFHRISEYLHINGKDRLAAPEVHAGAKNIQIFSGRENLYRQSV